MSLKSVMAKLAGIEKERSELASHKIELALIDDVKKAYTAAENAKLDAIDARNNMNKLIQKNQGIITNSLNVTANAVQAFDKFEAAAKELGVEIPANIAEQKKQVIGWNKTFIPAFKKAFDAIKLP
jgi:hypothetical protein